MTKLEQFIEDDYAYFQIWEIARLKNTTQMILTTMLLNS